MTGPGFGVAVVGWLLEPLTEEVPLGIVTASLADLLRLTALPVFGWAAWRDVKTRRVPGETWRPLVALGVVLFFAEAWANWRAGGIVWDQFALQAGLAVGFVVPLAYLFWRIGGFGGADVKAVMVLAVLFPTYPSYVLIGPLDGLAVAQLPPAVTRTAVGVFAFTVLTNAVLVGALYAVGMVLRNALAGRFSPVMFVGHPVSVERIPETYGRLLERPGGTTRRGLDLDALRMYLRWRGLSLAELRADPDRYRDPDSLPDEPNDPTDGNVRTDGGEPDPGSGGENGDADGGGGADPDGTDAESGDHDGVDGVDPGGRDSGSPEGGRPDYDDPWGAAAFLDDIRGNAYGTRPDDLRDGLEVLAASDAVWISPGLPFIVPLFLGLVIALGVGDVLFGVFRIVGIV